MQNNHYQVYLKSVFDLAASIVIKSHKSAELLNTYIDTYHGAGLYLKEDPRTWKYYKNLCGEYFQTDAMMTVTSIDSLEVIEFTKENLALHRATAEGYAYGTKRYQELVLRYPDNAQLIHGILYPANMEEAVSSDDYHILSWANEFIMPQETQLIDELRAFVRGYFERNAIVGFTRSDDLFLAALLADIADQLPSFILLVRAKYVKTRFAHDYHILQYLSSHSDVGKYIPMLTHEQKMWLYRNINYIERNSGKGENFQWLIDNLLTNRSIPIAEFNMGHDISVMPEYLTPEPLFFKKPLNTASNIDAIDEYNHPMLLALQDKILPLNADFRPDTDHLEDEAIRYTPYNEEKTKVLESSMIDYTDSERTRHSDIALTQWLSMSQKDLYTSFINFEIPSSGEVVTISVKDAYPLMLWCITKSLGRELPILPVVTALKAARTPHPTLADIKSVVSSKNRHRVDQIYATMPMVRKSISIQDFYNQTRALFVAAEEQWAIVSNTEHMITRGEMEAAASRLWCFEAHKLAAYDGQTYEDWFVERNLDFSNYNNEQLAEIAAIITSKAVGAEYGETNDMKMIQKALIALVSSLSSYSIQIGSSINAGPVYYAGCLTVRLGDTFAEVVSGFKYTCSNIVFSNIKGGVYYSVEEDIMAHTLDLNPNGRVRSKYFHEVASLIGMDAKSRAPMRYKTPMRIIAGVGMSVTNLEPLPPGTARTVSNVPGMAAWLRLSPEERAERKMPYKVDLF